MDNNNGEPKKPSRDFYIYQEGGRKIYIRGDDLDTVDLNFQVGLFIKQKSRPNRTRWFPLIHILELDMPGTIKIQVSKGIKL